MNMLKLVEEIDTFSLLLPLVNREKEMDSNNLMQGETFVLSPLIAIVLFHFIIIVVVFFSKSLKAL